METIKLFELAERYHRLFPKNDMIASKQNGIMREYSTTEYIETTNNIAYGLLNTGIQKNDKICIISSNRPEWSLVDMGINKIGAVNVGVYPNITRKEYKYIINDCGAKIVFVGSKEIYENIKGLDTEITCLEYIFSFDEIENVENWLNVIEKGVINPRHETMKKIQDTIHNDDLFTLIYTSGTTGQPKGVMLNHKNVISQITTLKDKLPIGSDDRAISFLPLCHVFERMIELESILG